MKSPLLLLAACYALGILAAHALSPGFQDISVLLATAGGCLLLGLIFLRQNWIGAAGFTAIIGFVLAGMATTTSFQNRFPPNDIHNLAAWGINLKRDVHTEGVIVSNPVRGPDSFRFDLECRRIEQDGKWRKVRGKVQARLYTLASAQSWAAVDRLNLRYGDLIRAPVRFERPWVYRNPGSFDFRWWLEAFKDTSWEGNIKRPLLVQKLSESQAPHVSMFMAGIRARLLHGIDGLYPPWSAQGRVGAVLKAVLLGSRSSLDSSTVENFRQSGLYHLLVISGLHVGLFAAVLLFFLNVFRVGESWRAGCLLSFLAIYSLLVEQRAPTLRASLMIAAYLLARYLYRDRVALNAVGLAGLVLLFYRPAWLFEAGFDLSFSAALLIAGLALPILQRTTIPYRSALLRLSQVERDSSLAPRQAQFRLDLRAVVAWLKRRFSILDRHPVFSEEAVTMPVRIFLWVIDLVLFSAIIQVGLLMPMAETFHRITLVGIGLNAFALPLMTVLIALAVPTVILAATIPVLAILPGKLLFWVTSALLALTEFRGAPLWLSYRIPGPPAWVAVGFALAVVAAGLTLGRSTRLFWGAAATFAVFTAMVVLYPFPPKIPRGMLEVTALDCGRGEALFGVLPDGTTLLVDAGGKEHFGPDIGRWNPGEEVVSPYLWSRGIKKIDIAVMDDGGDENIKAMEAILRNFKVGELWSAPRVSSPEYGSLIETARERGIRIQQVTAGDGNGGKGTDIQVLWPPRILPSMRLPFSDRSPVVRITDKDGSILLRGNTDDRIEQILADSGVNLSSVVLQSARSLSEITSQKKFLVQVNPAIVLRTAGHRKGEERKLPTLFNEPGFPRVPVFQTAGDGAVTIDLKKNLLTVRCYGTSRVFAWHLHSVRTPSFSGL